MSEAPPNPTADGPRSEPGADEVVQRNQFGTFGGVFTPTILTILGVIMFMRSGFVVGQGGIIHAILILLLAKTITFFTALSISAISTNTKVRGGGAYFLISRSLGPEFGGAIGVALFLAQALSVPFYVLGFTEALVATFSSLQPHFLEVALATGTVLFVVSYVGASWAIRVQFFVLAALVLSIVAFMSGLVSRFDPATFAANRGPAPVIFEPLGFFALFALYFPAVTGIMAGVNMSGDLKDPARSLPLGTLAAMGVGFLVYLAQALLMGGAIERVDLIQEPYESLVDASIFGLGFAVTIGVFAATLSSAIGSFVGAPRVLQALARDELLSPLHVFAQGSRIGDEPRRALLLTMAITVGVLYWSGAGGGGDALNQVAAVVSMFFLATYGVVNLAAFVEAVGANPSFRPRFRFFHWSAAAAGSFGCIASAILIDPVAAGAAVVVIFGLYAYVRRKDLQTSFGDARRGFVYTRVRNNLLRLQEMPTDAKNWRPTVLVLSGNPRTRLTLVTYAFWLEAGHGVVSLARLIVGELPERAAERREALAALRNFVIENEIPAFVEAAVVPDFDQGLRVLLQTHSVGPLKPNIVLFGWSAEATRADAFLDHLRVAAEIGMSLLLLIDRGLPSPRARKRIDIWWRGRENGSLMLILAHLLSSNQEWSGASIRILRLARSADEREEARVELYDLVRAARIDAEVCVVESEQPFKDVLLQESENATVVFLGFQVQPELTGQRFQAYYGELVQGLPTTLLVRSSGDADLFA